MTDFKNDFITSQIGYELPPCTFNSGTTWSRQDTSESHWRMTETAEVITTAAGAVEVEIHGTGTPVIVLHGSPGGIDAARTMSRFLTHGGFRVICLSRPGYLRTPLDPIDGSIDHESDLFAAVLDAMGVQRAAVLAWSGGGPAAFRFAVRHPTRVSAIVAIAAVSSRCVIPPYTVQQWLYFGTALGERLIAYLSTRAPEHVVN